MAKNRLEELMSSLQVLQQELEQELDSLLAQKRADFQYTLDKGKVHFKRKIREFQRQKRMGLIRFFAESKLRHILSAPVIYSVILPLVFLDIFTTSYQHICFRLYGIPIVKRSDYLVFDRQNLDYLNIIEKLNCLYCGYGNGLIAYIREIIARTEQYWCPIKHARKILDRHHLTDQFLDYGDAESYHEKLFELRKALANIESKHV